jgi:hypothetical protein
MQYCASAFAGASYKQSFIVFSEVVFPFSPEFSGALPGFL